MTIEETAAIAEIINAVAVTLTLLGLIVTIRQNTKSQKAMAVDSLAAAIAAINVPATQSSALGSALSSAVNDWASATRDARCQRSSRMKPGTWTVRRPSSLNAGNARTRRVW